MGHEEVIWRGRVCRWQGQKKKRVDVAAVMSRVAKDLLLEGKIREPEASSEDTEDDDSTDDNESPDEENEDDSSSNDTHPVSEQD